MSTIRIKNLVYSIIIYLLYLIKSHSFDINHYVPIYEDETKLISGEDFIYQSKNHNDFIIKITQITIIKTQSTLIQRQMSFSFEKVIYLFTFNFSCSYLNMQLASNHQVIIEHSFDTIFFSQQSDMTFVVYFSHDHSACNYFLLDLIDYFPMDFIHTELKEFCGKLTSILTNEIIKITQRNPVNEEAMNLGKFINNITNTQNHSRSFECDYRLNKSHTIIDLIFNSLKYETQERQKKYSKFSHFQIDFSYNIIDFQKQITFETDQIIFDHLFFGKNMFIFSPTYKGKTNLSFLIKNKLNATFMSRDYNTTSVK